MGPTDSGFQKLLASLLNLHNFKIKLNGINYILSFKEINKNIYSYSFFFLFEKRKTSKLHKMFCQDYIHCEKQEFSVEVHINIDQRTTLL